MGAEGIVKPTYENLCAEHVWEIPDEFNIGVACSDLQHSESPALIVPGSRAWTFGELAEQSNRFANALRFLGVESGDRVAIVLPQCVEAGIAHLAIYKIGAIAVPLSRLFGPDALLHRLSDSGARLVITNDVSRELVESVSEALGRPLGVITASPVPSEMSFASLCDRASSRIEATSTKADEPALLIYTSGTTGPSKGALHAHRVLLGHVPGFTLSHDFFPQDGDCFWTPADWAWIGGLMDALLPSWFLGKPVVAAQRDRFDPEWAADLIAATHVRNAFFPPTALRLMRQADVGVERGLLRSVMSGGETLDVDTLTWAQDELGVTVNEIYGQTEANYVVGNSSKTWPVRPGSMGRAYPGHTVTVLDEDGEPTVDAPGEIAVASPDPVMFLEYWNDVASSTKKFTGTWLRTGDRAVMDSDGYLWFGGRDDDVIISAGYRIGPEEIEHCLLKHDAVRLSGVVGAKDTLRGEVIRAFVELAPGFEPSAELADNLRLFVGQNLARFEAPREVTFVQAIPLTVTGKVRRHELREFAKTLSDSHGAFIRVNPDY